ncbi:DExH-box ATP-dependent RNA helicase DExH8-like [Vicia villosa]|uniref:DExH-box ATP-dependent RNA helicase DExH8-like n=1 Tax=Vicia villosa TaxID=3911 RepID=UPI00273CC46C|nr:DExH-box ATP-dependent RNA helicase DExH8-like [Vicia villosa]
MAASPPSSPPPSPAPSISPALLESTFSHLPVMSMRKKIVDKIQQNRVTLIIGETGCGKSSQIPQFLLEENMTPILCTLPRRFAVVSVAKMVAKARNCQLGEQVGYHIGHSRHFSASSEIVFKTAGVLLDEMQEKGLTALNYKVIILDEVHERSVESDLVLVCVKQFLLKNNDLRVVLMSATADISRYRDYFRDLGRGERVEVLAIPSSNQNMVFQRSVSYVDQVAESLGISSEIMHSNYSSCLNLSQSNAYIKSEMHKLIHELVLHIHKTEPDIEKSILVFLPTYYSLEQQWRLLKPLESTFRVHILHGSIDTEQALMTMKITKSHRKVILATNIAESSVTIPKVAYVIDSCRSLQVYWDKSRKKECAALVWVSKSQANQRSGRTGRTCDGQVYRLVPRSFYNDLEDHESPVILKLSLKLQILSLCCAGSKAINDPKVLLQKALDPPDPQIVEDALDLLVQMRALVKTPPRGRYEPTFYGRLLASFSLSFDASVLVLKFGDIGMIREGILLGILMDTQPLPIIHPFGEDELFAKYIDYYYSDRAILAGRKEMEFMANFCAFQFWQHIFKDKYRLEHLKDVLKSDNVHANTQHMPKLEEDWCSFHNLYLSSLHQVSEIYNDILNTIHRFRPKFLSSFRGPIPDYDPYEFRHICLLQNQPDGHSDVVSVDEEGFEPSSETTKCVAVPYVTLNHLNSYEVAKMFAVIVKETRAQYPDDSSRHLPEDANDGNFHVNGEVSPCVYFIRGFCSRGSSCSFLHTFQAKRPQCKFFFSLQGCRNGESCVFSHDMDRPAVLARQNICLPEENTMSSASLLNLFPKSSDKSILILDDTSLRFSSCLACHYDPSKIISTTSVSEITFTEPSLTGVRVLWGLNHPYQTVIAKAGKTLIPWNEVQCVLWFPCFDSYGEDLDGKKKVLQNFFEYLAIRILADDLKEMKVIITMNNIRFSQLQVEKLGRDCFFMLKESFAFDEISFGILHDCVNNRRPMVTSRSISYVFSLQPPTHNLFSDYGATLEKLLHKIQIN